MKKVFDMDYLIKEAEELILVKPKTKFKTIDPSYHPFINSFLDYFSTFTDSQTEQDKKISYKILEERLSGREQYTLKKQILDSLGSALLGVTQENFFNSTIVVKYTSKSSFNLANKLINDNQIAYVYLNIQPQSTIKFTKNSQVFDPIDGTIYELESYYQDIEKKYYNTSIDSLNISAELPLFVGIVVLNKIP